MTPVPPRVLSRAETRAADGIAATRLGLPALCLMENAGRGLADVTASEIRRYGLDGAVVVAARGNNGGDGLVAARHLRRRGIPVRILLASPPSSFGADSESGIHLAVVRTLGIPVVDASDASSLAAAGLPAPGEVVVDAVLGTGLEGPVHGHLAEVLRWMGASGRPVVAADLPSGLDADTGALLGPAPRCVATATFLAVKRGLVTGRGPEHAGRVVVCDIGVPVDAVTVPS